MYNLLVTVAEGAWDLPAYEFDRTRFLEYTSASLKAKYGKLTAEVIEEIKSFPALFTYEGRIPEVKIGFIRRIKERGRTILIEYDFDTAIPPFSFAKMLPHTSSFDVGISDGEMHRTHWALKDEDLYELLRNAEIIAAPPSPLGVPFGRVEEMRFKVALSFPGEKREYVSKVAEEVKKRLGTAAVFYDKDFTAQLARPNLDTLLQKIYLNNSDLVVVFLCNDYERKEWCGLEWRAVRTIIKNKNDHAVMFMRFDAADVSGTMSIDGYVDLDEYSAIEAARMIVERVRLNELPPPADG